MYLFPCKAYKFCLHTQSKSTVELNIKISTFILKLKKKQKKNTCLLSVCFLAAMFISTLLMTLCATSAADGSAQQSGLWSVAS